MSESLIKKINSYVRLKPGDEDIVTGLFRSKNLSVKEYFLREGSICAELGFIENGLLYYSVNENGTEVITNFAKAGDFVCNYDSFLNETPSVKNIKALEETELKVISKNKLQELYSRIQNGERFGRLFIEKEYSESIKQLVSLYTDSPGERYLKFVRLFPDLVQRIPQYYIAAFVGVKPQSLSRIRKKLSLQ